MKKQKKCKNINNANNSETARNIKYKETSKYYLFIFIVSLLLS